MEGTVKQKGTRTWRFGKFSVYPCCKIWESMLWKEHHGMARQSFDKEFSLETINHLSRNSWQVGLMVMYVDGTKWRHSTGRRTELSGCKHVLSFERREWPQRWHRDEQVCKSYSGPQVGVWGPLCLSHGFSGPRTTPVTPLGPHGGGSNQRSILSLKLTFGMGMGILGLSHHCILEANSLSGLQVTQLKRGCV